MLIPSARAPRDRTTTFSASPLSASGGRSPPTLASTATKMGPPAAAAGSARCRRAARPLVPRLGRTEARERAGGTSEDPLALLAQKGAAPPVTPARALAGAHKRIAALGSEH